MSIFQNMTTEGLEESKDTLGGFQRLESGIYTATIKALYAGRSRGGATSVSLIADIDGQEYRETFYVTNKEGQNFYVNQNKKKVPLPGFTVVDDLCVIATGEPLAAQETEEKVINLYDRDAGKEVPTTVPMLTGALGQQVALGIIKQIVDKTAKNDATGEYEPTGETREENVVDKVFHPETKQTYAEARNEQAASFWDKWLARNEGQTRDRSKASKGQVGGGAPKAGAPKAGGTAAPKKKLFGS